MDMKMIITAEIILHIFKGKYPVVFSQTGTTGIEFTGVRKWERGMNPERGILYLLQLEKSREFFDAAPENPILCLMISDNPASDPEAGKNCASAVVFSERAVPSGLRPQDVAAVFSYPSGLDQLWHEVDAAIMAFYQWQSDFSEDILHRVPENEIFAKGRRYLPWVYTIVDNSMNILYAVPGTTGIAKQYHEMTKSDILPDEIAQHFMLSKSFHDVAKTRHAFYYQNELFEEPARRFVICRNIFLDEESEFFARIVMYPDTPDGKIDPGAREIFEIFSDQIQDFFRYGVLKPHRHSNDQMHWLCRSILSGRKVTEEVLQKTLREYNWKNEDTYTACQMTFYEEKNWKMQKGTTLPYIALSLEHEWKNSCAVNTGKTILWVINQTRSDIDTDRYKFHQRVATYVRDHVCRVGISPIFSDFRLLPDAVRSAEIALDIGQQENPQFWYYQFDDYRLSFFLKNMKGDLPIPFAEHPALQMLRDYDKKYCTDLYHTLEVWLEHSGKTTEAAAALYVHRSTLLRRMEHIHSVTGLVLEDADERLTLQLSFRLAREQGS